MQLGLALSPGEQVHELMEEYGGSLADFEQHRRAGGRLCQQARQPDRDARRPLAGLPQRRGNRARRARTPARARCQRTECSGLWTLDDGGLFWELLDAGHRSPVFQTHSAFGVHSSADFWDDMGFCYLATPYEVARLEFPLWVAGGRRCWIACRASRSASARWATATPRC